MQSQWITSYVKALMTKHTHTYASSNNNGIGYGFIRPSIFVFYKHNLVVFGLHFLNIRVLSETLCNGLQPRNKLKSYNTNFYLKQDYKTKFLAILIKTPLIVWTKSFQDIKQCYYGIIMFICVLVHSLAVKTQIEVRTLKIAFYILYSIEGRSR